MSEPPKDTTIIGNAIWGLPRHALSYTLSFAVGIATNVTLTSLFIGSVALGFAVGPWAGVAAFFLIHVMFTMTNTVSDAIFQGHRVQAARIAEFTRAFTSTETAKPQLESDPGQ